jgi:hypothetical protein
MISQFPHTLLVFKDLRLIFSNDEYFLLLSLQGLNYR